MLLNKTQQVIALFNVSFGKKYDQNAKPFSLKEWYDFGKWIKNNNIEIEEFLKKIPDKVEKDFDLNFVQRISDLLSRGTTLALCLEKWERAGIWLKFRNDADYPSQLKKKLKGKAPVILFGVGDYSIVKGRYIGIVGSRNATSNDLDFTENLVKFLVKNSLNVVSGGAKGIDLKSMVACLENGGNAIGFLGDSLLKQSISKQFRDFISSNKLLLLSSSNPEAGFSVGLAMQRNKYIYCMSEKSVIVTCTPNKGGTWAGALENHNNNWVQMYVQKSSDQKSGNSILENYNAIPIKNNKEEFNSILKETNVEHLKNQVIEKRIEKDEQKDLFE